MTSDHSAPTDLRAVAYQALLDAGFVPDIPPDVEREVQAIDERRQAAVGQVARDLRSLLWSSIDNPESRDLDQAEIAERQSPASTSVTAPGLVSLDAAG